MDYHSGLITLGALTGSRGGCRFLVDMHDRRPDIDQTNMEWRLPMWCGPVSAAHPPQQPLHLPLRMCQKQFGNFFGAFAGVSAENFV